MTAAPITLAKTEQLVEVQRLVSSGLSGWVFAAQDAKGRDLSFLAPPAYGLWLYDQLQAEGPFPLVIDEQDALS
jgi:hypothetical protein